MKNKSSGLPRLLWATGSVSAGSYSQRRVLHIHEMAKWFRNTPELIIGWEGSTKPPNPPLTHYLHQGIKHSQDSDQALLIFTVWEDATSLLEQWQTAVVVLTQAAGNPASALPQSKCGCLDGFSRDLFFACFVAGANLTSDFVWWRITASLLQYWGALGQGQTWGFRGA